MTENISMQPRKRFLKFAFILAAIFALAFLALAVRFAPDMWRAWKAQRIIQGIERQYREDTYGGKTPEETFNLFVDALKKGDLELASKYGTLYKQEELLRGLQRMQRDNLLDGLVEALSANTDEYETERKFITPDWYKIDIYKKTTGGREYATHVSIIRPKMKWGYQQTIWKIDSI